MMGLTRRQAECLAIVRAYIGKHGISPSYEEIQGALGVASKSVVWRLISALVDRGYLVRIPSAARSLALRDGALTSSMEAGLTFLAQVTGKNRDQLVAQALEEFLARQVRP